MSEARRRITVKKPGGYSAFDFDETPLEAPGPGQVQIDVRACGINFADIGVRLGLYATQTDFLLASERSFSYLKAETDEVL